MAHDEWDDIETPEGGNEDEELNEEPIDETSAKSSGKYDKLLSSDSRKYKLSGMFKDWFLDYSSYVILQRAVPHIVRTQTGAETCASPPVQNGRRKLH